MAQSLLPVGFVLFAALLLQCTWAGVPPSARIVGGKDAEIAEFPYQISLQRDDGSHTCGATILNERFALTAAHCVVVNNGIEPYPPQFYQARIGSIQYKTGGELRKFKRIIVNKDYGNFLNDVALLEFEAPLVFNKYIQSIELADARVPGGQSVIVSGWGRLYQNGPIPNRLQWNTLSAITVADCDTAIGFGYESTLCLAHTSGNGVCNGDSGGPATYQGKLVGVANIVYGGCGTDNPDGYADVSYHREWILKNMGM